MGLCWREYTQGTASAAEQDIPILFGKDLEDFEDEDLITMPEHRAPIPRVLHQMETFLSEWGAYEETGIFRSIGERAKVAAVKRELNERKFKECEEVSIVAQVIKVAFFVSLMVLFLNLV